MTHLDMTEEFLKPLAKPIILLHHEAEWIKSVLMECERIIQETHEFQMGGLHLQELRDSISFLQDKRAGKY